MEQQLVVQNLAKHYGSLVAVDSISFSVAAGQIFGLLGKNGAGKTTAIECIVGLRKPDAGEIHICGVHAIAQPRKIKQFIGVQLQATALQDKITPREAIKLFAAFYERAGDAGALLHRFSLTDKADNPFDSLSGGQKQRLALALAFVNDPKVVVLDEPTAGLDAAARRQLHEDIRRLRDQGRAVLLTTHYIEEAAALCDPIAIMDAGRIVARGTVEQLIGQAGLNRNGGHHATLEDAFIVLSEKRIETHG